ncbi:MAG TPA: hypothetical protein VMO76_11610 [Candidatus Udaeobacter sp.]|jgi:hypothetical protein|nr:hypothetical protein [Candidatus Udaeobacter sp.]
MFTNYVSVYTRDIFVWADNRALDLVISEHERNRLAVEANERFVISGIDIKDVYGTVED